MVLLIRPDSYLGTEVGVRWDDYEYTQDGKGSKTPENPEGLDFHGFQPNDLELINVPQEEVDAAVESILRAAKER